MDPHVRQIHRSYFIVNERVGKLIVTFLKRRKKKTQEEQFSRPLWYELLVLRVIYSFLTRKIIFPKIFLRKNGAGNKILRRDSPRLVASNVVNEL